jgi:hypothetical protein
VTTLAIAVSTSWVLSLYREVAGNGSRCTRCEAPIPHGALCDPCVAALIADTPATPEEAP